MTEIEVKMTGHDNELDTGIENDTTFLAYLTC